MGYVHNPIGQDVGILLFMNSNGNTGHGNGRQDNGSEGYERQ